MADPRKRILLLSAYRADSHAAWADWLSTHFDEFDWQLVELPGRHFRWRIRGNPLSWLHALDGVRADALVATSMVDLATLRGLHPGLAQMPTLYYFHENQFAYPTGEHQVRSIEPQMVQLYGALAADRIAFNSAFNRDSFLEGLEQLLRRMPDRVPEGVRARIAADSHVLPVPIHPIPPAPDTGRDLGLVVWNHRWEYDKAPERFAEALLQVAARGLDFRLALLGPRPQQAPEPLRRLREQLAPRIVADGCLPRADYLAVLARAGIVVSTALHEFQGLAMLEAASAGARPLVPDALCYPDQYPDAYRYPAGNTAALAQRLAAWLINGLPAPIDTRAWHAQSLREPWQQTLEALLEAGSDQNPGPATVSS